MKADASPCAKQKVADRDAWELACGLSFSVFVLVFPCATFMPRRALNHLRRRRQVYQLLRVIAVINQCSSCLEMFCRIFLKS